MAGLGAGMWPSLFPEAHVFLATCEVLQMHACLPLEVAVLDVP